MRHLSLFSGVGGIDLGFQRAGMTTVGHVELDPKAREVLKARFPGVPTWHDVTEVTADDLPDRIDVLSGGFPCQDISVAGKRQGLDGERSGLWFEFARLISEIAPSWVVVENVPGLLSSNGGRDLGTVLRFLGDNGFRWAYRVLDAQWFGVAQRRRRVFIVANRGAGVPTEILFEPSSVSGNPPPSRETGPIASALTRDGSGLGGGGVDDNAAQANHLIAFSAGQGAKAGTIAAAIEISPTLKAAGSGTNQAPTIAHPTQGVRRLMPVECERLQGFPDGWSSNIVSDSQAYRQMGNAVCVPVAEWIGRRLMNCPT